MEKRVYQNLGLMAVLHFVLMYVIMYAMVDTWGHVYSNLNTFYMAGMMTAPMIILEIFFMKGMYQHKAWNRIAVGGAAAILIFFWFFVREQTAIGDRAFLRSMIPHHSGAILMCQQAAIERADVRELCRAIVRAQEEEIAEMERILETIDKE